MRTLIVPNDFVELMFYDGPDRPTTRTPCSFAETCLGLSCGPCTALDTTVDSKEEAVEFFLNSGLRELRKSSNLVRVRTPVNPTSRKTVCHWVVQCPRDRNLSTINCISCPASRFHAEVTLEEAVAWWEEAKLIRRYR